jgi:hypothetical protein
VRWSENDVWNQLCNSAKKGGKTSVREGKERVWNIVVKHKRTQVYELNMNACQKYKKSLFGEWTKISMRRRETWNKRISVAHLKMKHASSSLFLFFLYIYKHLHKSIWRNEMRKHKSSKGKRKKLLKCRNNFYRSHR